MKIGLIDVDGHNFPNLALMKLSAWQKELGNNPEWYNALLGGCYATRRVMSTMALVPSTISKQFTVKIKQRRACYGKNN